MVFIAGLILYFTGNEKVGTVMMAAVGAFWLLMLARLTLLGF